MKLGKLLKMERLASGKFIHRFIVIVPTVRIAVLSVVLGDLLICIQRKSDPEKAEIIQETPVTSHAEKVDERQQEILAIGGIELHANARKEKYLSATVTIDQSVAAALKTSATDGSSAGSATIPSSSSAMPSVYWIDANGVKYDLTLPPVPPVYPSDLWLAMFGKWLDADGFIQWELFAAQNGYAIFYVGPAAPDYLTFSAAQSAAQKVTVTGKPAAIFFRSTWPNGIIPWPVIAGNNIELAGISPALPSIIARDGVTKNPRPIITREWDLGGKQAPQNLVVSGFDFEQGGSNDTCAMAMITGPFSHVMLDNCRAHGFQGGFQFQCQPGTAPFTTLILNRCQCDHNAGANWQVFCWGIADLLIQDSLIDYGYSATVPKAQTHQNAYIQAFPYAGDPQQRVLGLMTTRAAAAGIQLRPGGVIQNLYAWGNPLGGFVGSNSIPPEQAIPGVTPATPPGSASGVVEGGGWDLSINGVPRGWGFQSNGCTAADFDLLILNKTDNVNTGQAVDVDCIDPNTGAAVPTKFKGRIIVHNWQSANNQWLTVDGNPAALDLTNCDWNGIAAPNVPLARSYPDATRTLTTYAASLGYSTVDTFLSAAAANRRGAWNAKLLASAACAWVRTGFGLN